MEFGHSVEMKTFSLPRPDRPHFKYTGYTVFLSAVPSLAVSIQSMLQPHFVLATPIHPRGPNSDLLHYFQY